MTLAEVNTMIAGLNLPYCYYEFPDGTEQAPPFVCFYYPGTDDVFADNKNYSRIEQLTIELYTDNKDIALEASLEAILAAHELTYVRTDTYIDSERMHMTSYNLEVLING